MAKYNEEIAKQKAATKRAEAMLAAARQAESEATRLAQLSAHEASEQALEAAST